MTPQFLSEKMSRHLSSLAPGFEGHYEYWVINDFEERGGLETKPNAIYAKKVNIQCSQVSINMRRFGVDESKISICPAWQVEDVLKNLTIILKNYISSREALEEAFSTIAAEIISPYLDFPDTAYQKIEEYLWLVLK